MSDVAVEERRQLRFAQRAHFGGFNVAVFEQHQRWDATHAKTRRRVLVVVDVQFAHFDLALVIAGDFVQTGAIILHGPHHSAQ